MTAASGEQTAPSPWAQWVSAQFGISQWAARRWIAAGHALARLPRVRKSLSSGNLSLDKVLELTRFATLDTETKLIAWATGVSAAAIRRKADLAQRDDIDEARADDRARSLSWWYGRPLPHVAGGLSARGAGAQW
jgi:DNA polymerase III psi subunit